MKKLNRINLHKLSQAELAKREENLLKGGNGYTCSCAGYVNCGCKYAGEQEGSDDSFHGGSSSTDNSNANFDKFVTNNIHDGNL